MQKEFLAYIKNENLFATSEKILLTVSGGIDSVVMCQLFYEAGLKFGIAHCNFQLRGTESEEDEKFVKQLANWYKVPFYSNLFDTTAFAESKNVSIQMAARELRYSWFEEIRKKEKYKYIATAHHQDDSIETFFINLIRGTGIAGLHGILPKQRTIIRPLLFATKNKIIEFAAIAKLRYREDSSNASDKYLRNKIRHQIIPVLKEINPSLEKTINDTIQRLKNVEQIYYSQINFYRGIVMEKEKKYEIIPKRHFSMLNPLETYLYEFLKPYNFNLSTVKEIILGRSGVSGKQFFSSTHRLIIDRDKLIIDIKSDVQRPMSDLISPIKKNQKEIVFDETKLNFKTITKPANYTLQTTNYIASLDFDKLVFPLDIRKWKKGDSFYPFGMKGKKKLSDFFIDNKVPLNQKENTWLLTSAGEIVWIIGMRIDERFKVTDKTKKIYFAELVK